MASQNTPLADLEAAHLPPPSSTSSLSRPPSYMEQDMAEPLPTYKDVALGKIQQHRLRLPKPRSRCAQISIATCFAVVCIGLVVIPLALTHGHLDTNGDE